MKSTEPTAPSDDPPPHVRDEAWIEQFEIQATRELIEQANRYATKHARAMVRVGGRIDPMDLVMGVLNDTFAGVLYWDPTGASLVTHVIVSIRRRARHLREHAARYRHEAIDCDHVAADLDDASVAAASQHEATEAARGVARETLDELRQLAQSDPDVLVVLDAYARDAFTPKEVMAATGLTKKRYRNARLRLDRMVDRLCQEPGRVRA